MQVKKKVQVNVAFRDAAGRCVSDNRLGGNAAPTDFAGDVLDELLWFDERFFFLKLLPFPGQRHSLVDVGTERQRFVEGIRRARL